MDQAALFEAIDGAITKVAETEFQRLSAGMGEDALTNKVHATLGSFRGLRRGIPPDYSDPWVALFYLTWFQPGQIQLAHNLIDRMKQKRGSRRLIGRHHGKLQVLDIGCGALATLFPAAWAAADTLDDGLSIPQIPIYSYDESQAMIELGQGVWQRLKSEIANDSRLTRLETTFEAISFEGTNDLSRLKEILHQNEGNPRCERWMSAFHIVYEKNVEDLEGILDSLAEKTNPDIGLLTCHDDSASGRRLDQVSPFRDETHFSLEVNITSPIDSPLPAISLWRRELNGRISKAHNYLSGDVTWGFPDALGRMFCRKE